ncbi:MAG: substrate-binding domain-containing protein [Chloroflexaceae bacterium]
MMTKSYITLLLLLFLLAACGNSAPAGMPPTTTAPAERQRLRLITLPGIATSGLLAELLSAFEEQHPVQVAVTAVSLSEALVLGENSAADLLLLPAGTRVDGFVQAGHGLTWQPVLSGDLVLVGPAVDPAGVRGMPSAAEACKAIADTRTPFLAPGAGSFLQQRVQTLWEQVRITPTPEMAWYRVAEAEPGALLPAAAAQSAYTLTERAGYLARQDALPNLAILVGGDSLSANPDPTLRVQYGVIPINLERHPDARLALAETFAAWLTSAETQARIAEFGHERYGQPVFVPEM